MKRFIALTAACAAFLTITTAVAHATVTPSQSTPVGLEHDPEGIVARGRTNGSGDVTFSKLKQGNYTVLLTDTSTLRAPATVLVKSKLRNEVSAPIAPGKRGTQAFALDTSGRKLTVVVVKDGESIIVHVQTATENRELPR